MPATIILLVGPSSAGKTSLSRALQQLLDRPFLHFQVDEVMSMVPDQCIDSDPRDTPPDHGGFWWRQEAYENAPLLTQIGPFGHRIIFAIHRAIRALADSGLDLIVDDVIYEPAWLDDYLQVLCHEQVLFVAVRCNIEELERREIKRGDRKPGQARGDLTQLYEPGMYDLEVDTGVATSEACARQIIERLGIEYPFQVWKQLQQRRRQHGSGVRRTR